MDTEVKISTQKLTTNLFTTCYIFIISTMLYFQDYFVKTRQTRTFAS